MSAAPRKRRHFLHGTTLKDPAILPLSQWSSANYGFYHAFRD